VAAVLIAVLTGCATASYVPPTDAKAASLVVRNDSDQEALVDTFTDPTNCAGRLRLSPEDTLGARSSFSIPVSTGTDFTVWISQSFRVGRGRANCVVIGTFKPVNGSSDVASFASDGGVCRVEMLQGRKTAAGVLQYLPDISFRARDVGGIGRDCK
jgi:hypothetical protein